MFTGVNWYQFQQAKKRTSHTNTLIVEKNDHDHCEYKLRVPIYSWFDYFEFIDFSCDHQKTGYLRIQHFLSENNSNNSSGLRSFFPNQ